ncbi:glycosyltransferase family 2 protein [Streptomyces sp. ODS05-4]|uniref:glycosyltransferase family 2 protein n=1 Tax=Streptomyces sp. ODS05-4 TaxID=2944939 RepID=UPI00210D5A96|nr:glycosyltransferase family 2 protein [Streptomyces sp. ODS05-4]
MPHLSPALIAVVGPVESPLLAAWVRHYRCLGVERFLIAFHFPDHVSDVRRHELQATARELGIVPTGTSTGPWHEHTNTELRDSLRHRAGPGWHLLADVDEFQQYPAPLGEVITQADESGHHVVGGLMLDRVAGSGSLTTWRPEGGLETAYPLGGHLTHRLLRGDPRKIVLARHDVAVASGNHRSPSHRPDADRLCAVHHFKWRSGILDDLRRRIQHFSSGTWEEHTPAVRDEAGRLLAHVGRHGGAINVSDPRFAFRRVSLDRMPSDWPAEARSIHTTWRSHAHSGQD